MNSHPRQAWLRKAVEKRLREELAKLQVEVNEEKGRTVDLQQRESFGFLGFEFRRIRSHRDDGCRCVRREARSARHCCASSSRSSEAIALSPVTELIEQINPVLRGWLKYFAVGHSSRCFSYIRDWVEKKVRSHLARASKRQGYGWKRWSREWLYGTLGLFHEYRVVYQPPSWADVPLR